MARIAVGGFQHETNTFAPQRATWADFERADAWPGFVRGPELIEAVEGYNIPIAGAVKALKEMGYELVPLCWCSAPPSSYVERDAYEKVAGVIIEDLMEAGPLNGIYLDLHGAMVAEHHEDGEGELLRRIRELVGRRIAIVTSLDFHTNLTPAMVEHATAMIGYRTYPHIDMAATGSRAAELLARLIKDRRPLYKAFRQVDFLMPLVWQCTLTEPAKGIFELLTEIEAGADKSGAPGGSHNQGIVSITHTPGFPPADIQECGPALVVYGHDKEAAEAAADRLLAAIQAKEGDFAGRLYTPDEAVVEAMQIARTATKPVVLADIQDNPGAGGTSDTVGLLRALIAHKAQGAVIGMMVESRGGREGGRARRRRSARLRRRCQDRLCRRDPDGREVAGGSARLWPLYGHRSDVWRRQVQHRPNGADYGRGQRRLGRARGKAHPGERQGNVPSCRRRAGRGTDPRPQIDRAFPRRFPADRRGDSRRPVAGCAYHRPGRPAV
jgi:microcystin degradation protein MlrC